MSDERHRKQEEDANQPDSARRSVHAERHRAEHGVQREEIAEDADHLRQPEFAEVRDRQSLTQGQLRLACRRHTCM